MRPISSPGTLSKARAYCARQERAQQELRDKLYGWGEAKAQVESIIAQLIGEGFLNEARFAEHFAVSKSRQKGWGKRKIEQALRMKRVSEHCIRHGLKAIDGEESLESLKKLVAKRWEREKELDTFVKRQKVMAFFLRKGYAVEEVKRALAERA
ncbi:MAG: RecX family transcriptional regulator [Flavobacteriales bacterium]|nr:RecX family transcriptional regulator [Flavobacteriales bacterium]